MSDQEFIDALQAEVKRLTDLNRQHVSDILMLQKQLEEQQKRLNTLKGVLPEKRQESYQQRRRSPNVY